MPDHVASSAVFAAAAEVDELATGVALIDVAAWTGPAGQACRERLLALCVDLVRLRDDLRRAGRAALVHERALAETATALAAGIV